MRGRRSAGSSSGTSTWKERISLTLSIDAMSTSIRVGCRVLRPQSPRASRCGDAATMNVTLSEARPPVKPSSAEAWSVLVGSLGQNPCGRFEITLFDEYLCASRQIKWVRPPGVIGCDPCVDPCGCEQAVNGLCLEPRRKRAYRDLSADPRTIRRNSHRRELHGLR